VIHGSTGNKVETIKVTQSLDPRKAGQSLVQKRDGHLEGREKGQDGIGIIIG
jgi:hypothetical protein